MTAKFTALAALLVAVCTAALSPNDAWSREIIHKERSLYQTILVVQRGDELCLQFSVRRHAERNQTCMNKRKPQEMVFSYTRMMMASLLLNPEPKRALIVGLGGGTLPTALRELYPTLEMDAVEVDGAVVKVAERYFGFTPDDRLRVHAQDARVFTKRALRRPERYDLILLDAYNGEYIPEHLMTREYLAETQSLLTPDGVLAANTFAISRLYDHESATYLDVFGPFWNFRLPTSANRVVLVKQDGFPDRDTLKTRAKALQNALLPYNVPIVSYARRLNVGQDWRNGARVLTDQYSPANLLNRR